MSLIRLPDMSGISSSPAPLDLLHFISEGETLRSGN